MIETVFFYSLILHHRELSWVGLEDLIVEKVYMFGSCFQVTMSQFCGCGYHFEKVTVMNAVILKSNSFIGKENIHS